MEKANGVNQQETKKEKKAPTLTIIYASRTHSQLAQVVGELRRTSYTPKVTVLGSREQLCIHDGLKNLRGNRLNHACSQKCAANSCKHKNNLQSYAGPKGKKKDIPIHDIEDLVKMGKQNSICPYFYTRDFAADADLVFVPYNYLLDNNIRETLRINWQGSIIIFDEAHNIERVAGDAASFTMTSADIGACIGELQKVLASLQNAGLGGDDTDSDILDVGGGKGDGKAETPTLRGVVRILKALFEFEKMIDRVPLRSGLGKTVSCTLPGDWMYTTLEQCGFSYRDALYNINELRRCSNYIIDKVMDAMGGNNALGTQTEPKLNLLLKAFTRVFSGKQEDMLRRASDYKVFVCEEDEKKKFSNYNRNSYGGYGDQDQHKKKRVVNYWAFSSGIAMADLKNLG
jgi:regulator of telomere elongation helicase 1